MVRIGGGNDLGRTGQMTHRLSRRSKRLNKQLYDKDPRNISSYYGHHDANLFDAQLFYSMVILMLIASAIISGYVDSLITQLSFIHIFISLTILGVIGIYYIVKSTTKVDINELTTDSFALTAEEVTKLEANSKDKRDRYITRPQPIYCPNCESPVLQGSTNCRECKEKLE